MIPLPFYKHSQAAIQISHYILPLALVTGITCLLAIGSYSFILLPSQSRLMETTLIHRQVQSTYQQHSMAWNTQQALQKVWEQLPLRKGFIGLGVSISNLAKTHSVRIPEIGYNIKNFPHNLATKGTMSFKAAGRYEDIRKFIYELESKWPQLFIEKLSAERAKKSNEVAFSMEMSTFLKENQDGGLSRKGSSL